MDEAALCQIRWNRETASHMTLLHSAVTSVMSGKEGSKNFEKTLNKLKKD